MSWRLPSGKALAEFALQAGFLAPLMLSGPQLKRGKKIPVVPLAGPESQVAGSPGISGPAISSKAIGSQVGEEPEPSGTFRKTGGYGEGGFRQGR